MDVRYIVDNVEAALPFYEMLLNEPGAGGAGQVMPDGRTPDPGGWNPALTPPAR